MSHRLNGLVLLSAMLAGSANAQPVAAAQRATADPRLRTVVFAADSVVATLDAANVPALAALDQHNAAVVVRARESYNFALLQRDYDQVARMTVPDTWAPYGGQFAGEKAMQSVIAAKEEHRVTVVSVRLTRAPLPGKSGEAVVTFDRQIRPTQGQTPVTTRFVSTVRFEYRPTAMKKPADRIENPFGFVVTGYRADADLVAPAKPVEATVGGAS